MELAEAMNKIAEDAAAEQAAMEAQQQQQMEAQPMSAEQQMSGAAGQAMTGGAPESVIPGANPSQQNLNSMLMALRGPSMGVRPGLSPGTV